MANVDITDTQIKAAREVGKHALDHDFHAEAAWYDSEKALVWIKTINGIYHGVPAKNLQGLQNGTEQQLLDIELSPKGTGLHWPQLDADLTVHGIMTGVYGTKKWMEQLKSSQMNSNKISRIAA